MKVGLALGFFFATIVAVSTAAEATTCKRRAENCVRLGGSQAQCFATNRMAECRKTKTYVAPSGRSWEADGR
jgi:hypothetical protein